jgi:hypothetical protein
MLSKSLSTSRKFAELPHVAGRLAEFCQALYPLLVVHADDFGRLPGDAFTVKLQVFPVSPRSEAAFAEALADLDTVRLIDLYQVEGRKFIQINQFDEHQSGLHKRTASKFPGNSGNFRELPGNSGSREEKRRELKRREEKKDPPLKSGGDLPRVRARPPAQMTAGVMAGTLPRDHLRHAWCSARICVPDFLHERLVRAVGEDSDAALRAFYAETIAAVPATQPIESDPLKFWPPLVTARWPSSPQIGTRTAALARASAEFLRGGSR